MSLVQNQRIVHNWLQKAYHVNLEVLLFNIVHIFIEIVLHIGILKKSQSCFSRLDLESKVRIFAYVVMTHSKNLFVFCIWVNFVSEFIEWIQHLIDAFVVSIVEKNDWFSFPVISKEVGQIVSSDFSYKFVVIRFQSVLHLLTMDLLFELSFSKFGYE